MKNLILASMKLGSGAYSPEVLMNYWKVAMVRRAMAGTLVQPNTNSRLIPYLLSPANRQAGASFYDMSEVQRALQSRMETGKDGQVVNLRFMPKAYNKYVSNYDEDICNLSGTSLNYKSVPYRINRRFRAGVLTLDDATIRCIQEGKDEFADANIARFFADAISRFQETVLTEIFSKDGSGKYKYIGNFASLNGVTPQLPGKQLPLYLANGYEPNFFGETILNEDMRQVGAPENQLAMFGTSFYDYYMQRKNYTRPTSDTGIDWAMIQTMTAPRFANEQSVNAANFAGLNDPLLVLEPGALQLVTRARNTSEYEFQDSRLVKGRIRDPYLNLEWDLTQQIDPCGDGVKVHMMVDIYWGLLGFPADCYDDYPRLKGITGVYLYDGACLDVSACTRQRYTHAIGNFGQNFDDTCTNDEVCDTPPQACTASLSAFRSPSDNSLRVTANFNGALGQLGNAITYTWTVNGSPVVNNTNTLSLASGTWDEGDVISVSIAQGTCMATASLTVSPSTCSNLVVDIAGTDYASGATAAIGNVAAGSTRVLTLENAGAWDLGVTSITSNSANLVVTMGLPATIASGQTLVGQIQLNGAAGPHSAELTFVSNDCNNPTNYKVTVTWTVA